MTNFSENSAKTDVKSAVFVLFFRQNLSPFLS